MNISFFYKKSVFCSVICLWVCIQLFLIINHWDFALHDDALAYRILAENCLTWYPDTSAIYHSYIFAPGYVNILILLKRLFGSYLAVNFLNLVMNISLLFFLYSITKKLFLGNVAKVAVYVFMLMYSNSYIVIAPLSDLPYLFFVMFAIYLLLTADNKVWKFLLVGFLLSISNWIRPLTVVVWIPILLYMFFSNYKKISYICVISSFFIVQILIGYSTYYRMGLWITSSTTSGYNLLMTASNNPKMGLVNGNWKKDPFYADYVNLQGKNVLEKDKIWRNRAIQHIKEYPLDYLKLIPLKFLFLHSCDNWSERVLPNAGFSKEILVIEQLFKEKNYIDLFFKFIILMSKSIFFYISLFGFLGYIYSHYKRLLSKENIFILIPIFNVMLLLIFPITDRYHYTYVPFLVMYTACFFCEKFFKTEEKV